LSSFVGRTATNTFKGENEVARMVHTDTSFPVPQVTRESANVKRE